jgi:hypothetical protein
MSNPTPINRRRIRFAPIAIITGVLAAVLLSLSLTGTLSGFTAQITNSHNTTATGALTMQEDNADASITCTSTDGGTASTNTATCATINKFGGSTTMVPGQTVTTPVTITNTGTVAANTFTLTPGAACTQTNVAATVNGSATDLCSELSVVITNTTANTVVYTGTLAGLAGSSAFTLPTVAAGVATDFSFAVTLNSAADNTYQGLQASLPLIWDFAS